MGPAGPMGPVGAIGPASPAGPQGCKGAPGAAGTSGFSASAFSAGDVNCALNSSGAWTFVPGTTVNIVVNAGETLHVFATAALGTANGKSGDASFDIGYRLSSSSAAPTTDSNDLTLSCDKWNRLPISLSQRYLGLPAGTYTVGLAAKTTSKQWNANDAGRVLAFTTR